MILLATGNQKHWIVISTIRVSLWLLQSEILGTIFTGIYILYVKLSAQTSIHMLTHLRLDNRRVGLGDGLGHVLAL